MKPRVREMMNRLQKFKDSCLPVAPNFGICGVAIPDEGDPAAEDDFEWLFSVFEEWPLHSGDPFFPVPAERGISAEAAYHSGEGLRLWDKDTPYGQARWLLLDFVLEKGEEYLEKESFEKGREYLEKESIGEMEK